MKHVRIELAVIDRRRLSVQLEQFIGGAPRRADRVFDGGEDDILGQFAKLTYERQISRSLGDHARSIAILAGQELDFIEKPIGREELIASIERALEPSQDSSKLQEWRESAATHLVGLTPRQREVMERVLAGHPSKNIAADLGISQGAAENHRASIMKRTGSKSLPALARLALVAAGEAGPNQVS